VKTALLMLIGISTTFSGGLSDKCVKNFYTQIGKQNYDSAFLYLVGPNAYYRQDLLANSKLEKMSATFKVLALQYGNLLGYENIKSEKFGKVERLTYLIYFEKGVVRIRLGEYNSNILSWGYDTNLNTWEIDQAK